MNELLIALIPLGITIVIYVFLRIVDEKEARENAGCLTIWIIFFAGCFLLKGFGILWDMIFEKFTFEILLKVLPSVLLAIVLLILLLFPFFGRHRIKFKEIFEEDGIYFWVLFIIEIILVGIIVFYVSKRNTITKKFREKHVSSCILS